MKIVFALLTAFFLSTHSVSAASPLFFDDFTSLDAWSESANQQFQDVNLPCRGEDGEYHWVSDSGIVRMSIRGSVPCFSHLIPKDLENFDARSYAVELDMKVTASQTDRNLLLRAQGSNSYLDFHIFGDFISVEKYINGVSYRIDHGTYSFDFRDNTTYFVRMEYDASSRNIRLFLNHALVISATESPDDPQLLRGLPGLRASVGAAFKSDAQFDNFTVLDLGSYRKIETSLFRQQDVRWGKNEYDSASTWSDGSASISRWGCALTSVVMMLHSYDIRQLPNGDELTPATLNAWLTQQSDGYLGKGLINWRAISRLSALLRNQWQTPALEFQYAYPTNKIQYLRDRIDTGAATILEEPGHFIVANAYGSGESDIGIRDPFYDRTSLAEYQNTYSSAREFTPSFTDLRAITIVVPFDMQVKIRNTETNTLLSAKEMYETLAASDQQEIIHQDVKIIDVAKPPPGLYSLDFFAGDSQTRSVRLLAYGSDGEVQSQQFLVQNKKNATIPITINESSVQIPDTYESIPIFPSTKAVLSAWLSQSRIRSPILVESPDLLDNSVQ